MQALQASLGPSRSVQPAALQPCRQCRGTLPPPPLLPFNTHTPPTLKPPLSTIPAPEFIERVELKYDEEAHNAGCYVASAMGFDSVPGDVGVLVRGGADTPTRSAILRMVVAS